MRVALFPTCIGDALFPDAHKASALVLARLGYEVVVPEGQTCCGQMHINTGYQRQAAPIVETYVEAFSDPSIDYVVAPSGSCAGAVRHQHEKLAARYGSPGLAKAAAETARKTYELTEFIVDVAGTTELGAFFPHRVTYHESCHSKRILGVGERPYQLLRNVAGLELVDLPLKEECCGFGGTFAVKMAEVSAAMVADKARHIKETEAEYVTAGDSSCLMNIAGALSRQHLGVRAVHIAEILASTREHPWTPTSAAYSREAML